MNRAAILRCLPGPLRRHILFFEAEIERAVAVFARSLDPGSRVLDAGAGEGRYAGFFPNQRYCGVDLGIGDAAWNYRGLDVVADLAALPFPNGCFDACLNIVTLEHLPDPGAALVEIARTLKPGGRVLLAVPHEWEVHQAPHDYFRFTRHGISHLLERAGFSSVDVEPAGGFFRLLSRRLLNGLQFFPPLLVPVAALFLAPPALLLPGFDFLDRERNFTLGYLCTAVRRS
ncbi:MAG TPA: class I SAM-dependent methyltransferase [Bryobacteraceae bacterium]|jgi:SAM-dependent methyltransferase|nr:class I SAM-dependent methyltransferase [Bryobacteraceae bacterium]